MVDDPANVGAVPLESGLARHRKALDVKRDAGQQRQQQLLQREGGGGATPATPATAPGGVSFEDVVQQSGLLDDRPPVEHGESGHSFYTVQPMQLLSWYPRAYVFPRFMDEEKCNHVVELAEKRLSPSGLALKKGDTRESTQGIRTSQGTFVSRTDDPDGVLAWIEDKIGAPSFLIFGFYVYRYNVCMHWVCWCVELQ